jgi:hypothetical protein
MELPEFNARDRALPPISAEVLNDARANFFQRKRSDRHTVIIGP